MLDISQALKNPGQVYAVRQEYLQKPIQMNGEEISFSPVVFSGEMFGADETVHVSGSISCEITARCAKCLEEVKQPQNVAFSGEFVRNYDETDLDRYPITGHEINLEDAACEALVLALPMRFLCREDCRGMCPVCGKNLNTEECTCPKETEIDPRLSVLKKLLCNQNDEEV